MQIVARNEALGRVTNAQVLDGEVVGRKARVWERWEGMVEG